MKSRSIPNQVIIGGLIVLIGLVFLLDTTGVVKTNILRWIPSLFILLGLWRLLASGFQELGGSLTLIAIAAFVQLWALDVPIGKWWPAIIIAVGAIMLVGGTHLRRRAPKTAGMDELDLVAVLGGIEQRVNSKDFKGGRVTAVMGGVDLDLREAMVAQRPATLDVTAVMGGVEIKVPSDWVVRNEATALLGGVGDERKLGTRPTIDGPPHLVITGLVLMGGVATKT